jgi:hypothetical protein
VVMLILWQEVVDRFPTALVRNWFFEIEHSQTVSHANAMI